MAEKEVQTAFLKEDLMDDRLKRESQKSQSNFKKI